MKKEVKKNRKNPKKILNIIKQKKQLIIKNYNIIIMTIPFILMDIITKTLGYKIKFYGIFRLVPILFTLEWIFLILGIIINLNKKKGKIIYSFCFIFFMLLFLLNNIYYSMSNSFFDYSLVSLASEGAPYIIETILNCNILVYISLIPIIISFFFGLRSFKENKEINKKNILRIILIFIIIHTITPILYGRANNELTWSTWRNPRNIYINFNDNNKSMMITGMYEYNIRNIYITFIKSKKEDNQEDLEFLNQVYETEQDIKANNYTGKYKDKNLIILQLEGIDDWLLNKEDTPTLYNMQKEGISFQNHYSYYNGGGSTFNSEFAVNTGFITPLSYNQNAYSFNKNTFPYTMAKLFKKEGYSVNAFHMNTGEYYSRSTNYKNWGYDNYYGLKDLGTYIDDSYILDRELFTNEKFIEKMFENDKFVNYIITYSNHLPFTTEKGVCKKLVTEDILKELNTDKIPDDYKIPQYTEEECARRQTKETDDSIKILLDILKEKELLEKTVIIVFTDHYLYTLSDISVLEKYKETSNNLINKTPFFIWDNTKQNKQIKQVTSQLNILPTIANLFDLKVNSKYFIGEDALSNSYKGYVFFNDYSWYDGTMYFDGEEIDDLKQEDKNYYINNIIKKNDLTLKYNYFKKNSGQN